MNNITQNTNPSQFAIADKRHINKYYYDSCTNQWFLILDLKLSGIISTWTMCAVNTYDGAQVSNLQTTQKDMEANKFADRPFYVDVVNPKTERQWFTEMVSKFNQVNSIKEDADFLYAAYIDRRRYCCSYDSLVRIGLRDATMFVNSISKFEVKSVISTKTTALDKLKALFVN